MRAQKPLDARSRALRTTIIETLHWGGRGHLAPAFSAVEILRVLYDDVLRFDPARPKWSERDRCILSKGHGCLALYALLVDKGFVAREELAKFCATDGILGGHPSHHVPGVEASTGSLGHGLPIGVGMAIHAQRAGLSHRVFVILGDGESDEGSVWEAALHAAKHRLTNLTVLIDYNKQQSAGTTFDILDLEPFADKWRAFGFDTYEVDGHDMDELRETLRRPVDTTRPRAILCHTIKGRGIPFVERNLEWHHKNKVTREDADRLLSALEGPA